MFNQITRHPDYYLTRCEIEILNTHKKQLSSLIELMSFNLVELGPGEGIKTKILIEQFMSDHLDFKYIPIDISEKYLKILIKQFQKQIPKLDLIPIYSDYFRGLRWLSDHSDKRNLVLFLGSSIGNFDPKSTKVFLQHLWESLNDGDYILIGFDLRKDVDVLMRAYNDDAGITRDFNLNLLERMNRELGANFNVNHFRHYATYNVYSGAMESYLISLINQSVKFDALERSIEFKETEPVHVEYSYKYLLPQIYELAKDTGFEVIHNFLDSKNYFVDSFWCANK